MGKWIPLTEPAYDTGGAYQASAFRFTDDMKDDAASAAGEGRRRIRAMLCDVEPDSIYWKHGSRHMQTHRQSLTAAYIGVPLVVVGFAIFGYGPLAFFLFYNFVYANVEPGKISLIFMSILIGVGNGVANGVSRGLASKFSTLGVSAEFAIYVSLYGVALIGNGIMQFLIFAVKSAGALRMLGARAADGRFLSEVRSSEDRGQKTSRFCPSYVPPRISDKKSSRISERGCGFPTSTRVVIALRAGPLTR